MTCVKWLDEKHEKSTVCVNENKLLWQRCLAPHDCVLVTDLVCQIQLVHHCCQPLERLRSPFVNLLNLSFTVTIKFPASSFWLIRAAVPSQSKGRFLPHFTTPLIYFAKKNYRLLRRSELVFGADWVCASVIRTALTTSWLKWYRSLYLIEAPFTTVANTLRCSTMSCSSPSLPHSTYFV